MDLITHNDITPAVNQIETHPFFQRADDQQLMREHGVQIESWGPFAEGKNDLFTNPTLTEIGEAHGKSVAQVVLRWLIQRDVVVIPKSVRPERMAENLDVFDFELTDDEMTRIAGLDTGASDVLRPPRPRDGQLARRPPRRLTAPRRRLPGAGQGPDPDENHDEKHEDNDDDHIEERASCPVRTAHRTAARLISAVAGSWWRWSPGRRRPAGRRSGRAPGRRAGCSVPGGRRHQHRSRHQERRPGGCGHHGGDWSSRWSPGGSRTGLGCQTTPVPSAR